MKAPRAQSAVTLTAPIDLDMTRWDVPIESAKAYVRYALLNDPDVISHLLYLADLREACFARPYWPPAAPRYRAAIASSLLLEQFEVPELDRLASIIRERLEMGVWGLSIPVSHLGPGYGRVRGKAKSMQADTLEMAVADLVHRLNPEREVPHSLAYAVDPATQRKVRQRVRGLASS